MPTAPATRPILASLAGYRAACLPGDLGAGLAIAAVGLPTAIAYPAIAGLPPESGLYASIAPLVAYAVFGPSRQLIVGPDAATITVMAAVLASIPDLAAADRPGVAAMLALVVGLLYLGGRLLGLGALSAFLSRPILVGFFAGISLSIITGQLKRVTGAPIASDGLFAPFVDLLHQLAAIHWPSLALAALMFTILEAARLLRLRVPGPVIVVVFAVALSWLLDLPARGVATVGDIPARLPRLALPATGGAGIDRLLLGAVAIFFVSFAAGLVTARSFGQRGGYPVDANREMTGFGAANIAAGLFAAFPVTASDSRTAINDSAGGRSQVAGIVAAGTLVLAILYLQPALAILPIPALGAILIAAALGLIDIPALRALWRIAPIEFVFAMIALVAPITLGVLAGVVVAIGATFAYLLHKMMRPRDALLGRIPGRDGFYKLHRHADARPVPGLVMALIEGDLLFFNADHVQARLLAIADAAPAGTRQRRHPDRLDCRGDARGVPHRSRRARHPARLRRVQCASPRPPRPRRPAGNGRPDMIFDDLDDALRAFEAPTCAPPAPSVRVSVRQPKETDVMSATAPR